MKIKWLLLLIILGTLCCTKRFSMEYVPFLCCRVSPSGTVYAEEPSQGKYILARKRMVETQIVARGISDERVLDAMLKVERHKFVPIYLRAFAYTDRPLPIGEGQTISQPYIVALMTELLKLDGDERVLEIGTGSGYQAAVLAELSKEVYTIEILEPLATRADKLLKNLGYVNITVKCGDGFIGWEEYAPFDGIIVTCAPEKVPEPLIQQLAEGGRMVIPVGDVWQELKLLEKKRGKVKSKSVIPVRFVPMTGKAQSYRRLQNRSGKCLRFVRESVP